MHKGVLVVLIRDACMELCTVFTLLLVWEGVITLGIII